MCYSYCVAKIAFPLISLIALISLIFNLKFIKEKQGPSFKVVEVIDGDTFKIDEGKRVRLMGIDAPESGRCLADEAKNKLTDLVQDKDVRLENQFTDPYGRVMANVFVGSTYINKEMAASGFVRLDSTQNPRRDELKAAGKFNNDVCISLDNSCKIKGNIDNEKPYKVYYLPNCKNYSQVTIDLSTDDQWFCSEKEAQDAGFIKSSTCP